jgi:hypothetical protein
MRSSPFRAFCECVGSSLRLVMLCSLATATAGCGTTIEESVPGARREGVYPNLNIPQQAATEQLTDEEAQAGITALTAVRTGQQSAGAGGSASEAERLRRLRESHGDAALKEIEKE